MRHLSLVIVLHVWSGSVVLCGRRILIASSMPKKDAAGTTASETYTLTGWPRWRATYAYPCLVSQSRDSRPRMVCVSAGAILCEELTRSQTHSEQRIFVSSGGDGGIAARRLQVLICVVVPGSPRATSYPSMCICGGDFVWGIDKIVNAQQTKDRSEW